MGKLWPLIVMVLICAGCAGGSATGGKAVVEEGAMVGTLDTGATQTERGTSVEDATITGNVVTSNAGLDKGWGGMLAVIGFVGVGLALIGWALPAPDTKTATVLLILGLASVAVGAVLCFFLVT